MSYCVNCRKKTGDVKKDVFFDEHLNRAMSKSKCADCGTRKSQFVSMKEIGGALNDIDDDQSASGSEEDDEEYDEEDEYSEDE